MHPIPTFPEHRDALVDSTKKWCSRPMAAG
jgi:hypothetical protein